MKKKLLVCLLAAMMALPFAIPVMAAEVVTKESVYAADQGIAPFTDVTRIYFRIHNGRLQARVWSITRGIWLTGWEYVN